MSAYTEFDKFRHRGSITTHNFLESIYRSHVHI